MAGARDIRAGAAAALLALAGLGAGAAPAAEGPPSLRVASVAPPSVPGARLRPLGALAIRGDRPEFGGFSALEVSADGARLVAVSDRGLWLEAGILRENGGLSGLEGARSPALLGPAGAIPPPVRRDAEGLAIAAGDLSGARAASFERLHRVARFDGPEGPERRGPALPREVTEADGNGGLEALAVAPDGRLLALSEAEGPGGAGSLALWLHPDGATTLTRLAHDPRFRPVGADFGPDGRLYVLGRRYSLREGFRFAIWRHAPEGHAPGVPEMLLEAPAGDASDNAEGLAVWRDGDGRLRVVVITDDNFSLMQRTLLIEYVLEE